MLSRMDADDEMATKSTKGTRNIFVDFAEKRWLKEKNVGYLPAIRDTNKAGQDIESCPA